MTGYRWRSLCAALLGLLATGLISAACPDLSRQIRITAVDLRNFPKVKLVISLTSLLGVASPASIPRVRVEEDGRMAIAPTMEPLHNERWPVYAVMALDRSGSMRGAPLKAARGAVEVYSGTMREGDRIGLVTFDTGIDRLLNLGPGGDAVSAALAKIRPGSDTAFLDALTNGVDMLRDTPPGGIRLLLAMTDGRDNRSRATASHVADRIREAGVLLCIVALGREPDLKRLQRLASGADGMILHAPSPRELSGLYARIGRMVHAQWRVTYLSSKELNNTWRRITVIVPRGRTEWRGERVYLAAEHSPMAGSGLRSIRKGQREMNHGNVKSASPGDSPAMVVALSLVLAVLAIALAVLLFKKRGRS